MIKNNLISITLKLLFHTRSFSFIAFLIFLSICFPRAYATESGIFNFSNINLKNGLSQLSVLAIAQDSKGYIWFATRNGLNKYDGEKFTIYKHDNDDPHSLSDNHITCLLPDDANEGLWVGTNIQTCQETTLPFFNLTSPVIYGLVPEQGYVYGNLVPGNSRRNIPTMSRRMKQSCSFILMQKNGFILVLIVTDYLSVHLKWS